MGAGRQEQARNACRVCLLARGANGMARGASTQLKCAVPVFVQILWKNLFRKVSVLDSVLFYKIDLFLIFRHVFFYK